MRFYFVNHNNILCTFTCKNMTEIVNVSPTLTAVPFVSVSVSLILVWFFISFAQITLNGWNQSQPLTLSIIRINVGPKIFFVHFVCHDHILNVSKMQINLINICFVHNSIGVCMFFVMHDPTKKCLFKFKLNSRKIFFRINFTRQQPKT